MSGLRPLFPYFGGKWRIARRYPAPLWPTLVEPFAGSAGYALRHAERRVVLIERYRPVAETWRYLIRVTEKEILALPDIADGQSTDEMTSLPEGARYLIGWWLNRGGTSPCKTPGAWMRRLRETPHLLFWGELARRRIASQLQYIRHWEICEDSYDRVPIYGPATWFVDPPYEGAGKSYRLGPSTMDFDHLAVWCRARTGQVIVCENEGAAWLPFAPFYEAKGMSGRGRSGKSREAMWYRAQVG